MPILGRPDRLDRLIGRLRHASATADVGIVDDPDNAQHLFWAEFGTITEPPRPTLSRAFDENERALERAIDRQVGDLIDGDITSGEAVLRKPAEDLAEAARENIDGNTQPPLAKSTIAARRGRGNMSDRTLVDTGKMRDAVRAVVREGVAADGGDAANQVVTVDVPPKA